MDELGLDRQAALEPKLKAALRRKILDLVRRKNKIKIKAKDVGRSVRRRKLCKQAATEWISPGFWS